MPKVMATKNGDRNGQVDCGPEEATPILLVQGLGGQLTFWPDELMICSKIMVLDQLSMTIEMWTYHSFEEYGKPNFIWNYIKFYTGLPISSVIRFQTCRMMV